VDPHIARSGGPPIGLRKPSQTDRRAERFQVGVRAVGRPIGNYDNFISVRRVCLLLKGCDDLSQPSKTVVRRYNNTKVGAGCLHCLGPESRGTGSIRGLSRRLEPSISFFWYHERFCYHKAADLTSYVIQALHPTAALLFCACILNTAPTPTWPKAEAARGDRSVYGPPAPLTASRRKPASL
jgi:hypothetical protein